MSNEITVKEDDDGQRFDRWLKKAVPDMPYTLSQKLIRKGALKINGKKAKADSRLKAGQIVRIPDFSVKTTTKVKKPKALTAHDEQRIREMIIYEDEHIIALNKPSGLAVQGGSGTKDHIDRLLPALINKKDVVPRLVHRLDKDTSGLLLLARSANVAKKLGEEFKSRTIRKIYWAITRGVPDPREGAIKAPLIKAGGLNKERMRVDEEKGKFALTEYAVVDHAHTRAAFVAFWPRTGRTHQIRAHAELLKTPILGDRKYACRDVDHVKEPIEGLNNPDTLHLHARRLIFRHPVTSKRMDITAPLPPALIKSWKALGFNAKDKSNPFEELED